MKNLKGYTASTEEANFQERRGLVDALSHKPQSYCECTIYMQQRIQLQYHSG